ncbi:hypothetical protein COOONC_21118 [Cooperia oncophora]
MAKTLTSGREGHELSPRYQDVHSVSVVTAACAVEQLLQFFGIDEFQLSIDCSGKHTCPRLRRLWLGARWKLTARFAPRGSGSFTTMPSRDLLEQAAELNMLAASWIYLACEYLIGLA